MGRDMEMDSMEMAWRAYASEHGWDGEDMTTEDIAEMANDEIDAGREIGSMDGITEDMIAWAEMHR